MLIDELATNEPVFLNEGHGLHSPDIGGIDPRDGLVADLALREQTLGWMRGAASAIVVAIQRAFTNPALVPIAAPAKAA